MLKKPVHFRPDSGLSVMANQRNDDGEYSRQETQRRLAVALRGAFSGPPTPLKHIPKKSGESRAIKRRGASAANAKTDRRRSENPA